MADMIENVNHGCMSRVLISLLGTVVIVLIFGVRDKHGVG